MGWTVCIGVHACQASLPAPRSTETFCRLISSVPLLFPLFAFARLSRDPLHHIFFFLSFFLLVLLLLLLPPLLLLLAQNDLYFFPSSFSLCYTVNQVVFPPQSFYMYHGGRAIS